MTDSAGRPTIMFVDDEGRVGRLLKMMFRGDYEVYIASGAREALTILETVAVDVIISDQRMPEVTGVELLSQVRSRWPETVRLLLTGYSDLVAIIASINEGEVHRFLNKPWEQIELRDAVAEAAELAESLRATRASVGSVWAGRRQDDGTSFSISSGVLVVDSKHDDRQQVRDILGSDYAVTEASTIEEAIHGLAVNEVGVVIATTNIDGIDLGVLLEEVSQIDPAIASVAMTSEPHSDAIIRLINGGRIFRFAIKPLSRNLFRSAAASAMREHHRRLTDPRIIRRRMRSDLSENEVRQRLTDHVERYGGRTLP
ncbi:Response regulator receiver modulated metal dependent phosphohydrolase [Agrobacterium tumefaciens str. Kerr 14]|uniref:Response regulator receiver modulated metal dependent phosphohydrolase n=1 Tax=Agrobacterium tumefaciens str. Kerr 14 TaxID=1183424 RepID=A0A1S7SAW9_AGRTU|nr:response regulator [Agrobacterium tumefaciens]CUX65788.1 Response regulator receiver modulated metal dependent phosphohydrolase [Agrobacterium tumefaciens str. Kerr 14]